MVFSKKGRLQSVYQYKFDIGDMREMRVCELWIRRRRFGIDIHILTHKSNKMNEHFTQIIGVGINRIPKFQEEKKRKNLQMMHFYNQLVSNRLLFAKDPVKIIKWMLVWCQYHLSISIIIHIHRIGYLIWKNIVRATNKGKS